MSTKKPAESERTGFCRCIKAQKQKYKALNEVGYAALFSTGVDETIKVIESYINQ